MFDVNHVIQHSGHIVSLLLIAAIIFTESGIPFGFFFPGDTLLFTAGFFAAQHYLPISGLILVVIIAKIAGSTVGYFIGLQAGKKMFNKKGSFFFRKDYLNSAESFYEKHGGKTVMLGQFIPVVRTFAPIVAGASKMNPKKFFIFNVLGAILWGLLLPLLGFWLGHKIHNIDKYLLPVIIIATVFSFTPAAWHLFGKKERRQQLINSYKVKKAAKNSKKAAN